MNLTGAVLRLVIHAPKLVVHAQKKMDAAYVTVTAPPVPTALVLQMVMLRQTVLVHVMVMLL